MRQPKVNTPHNRSTAVLPRQSIELLEEAVHSRHGSADGIFENPAIFRELYRPLVSKEQLLLTVVEVAIILSLSRTKVYELLYVGELPSVKIGASRRVRRVDLEKFVVDLELAD